MTEAERIEALGRLPVFNKMSFDALKTLGRYVDFEAYAAGETIYAEGEPSDFLGFIISGEVVLKKKGEGRVEKDIFLMRDRRGIGFALLDDQPWSATALALRDTRFAMISRGRLEELGRDRVSLAVALYTGFLFFMMQALRDVSSTVVENSNLIEYKTGRSLSEVLGEQLSALETLPLYGQLRDKWLERLTGYMRLEHHEAGKALFSEFDPSDFCAIVVSGEAELARERKDGTRAVLASLRKGSMLGIAMFDNYLRASTVTASTPLSVFVLDRSSMEEMKRKEPPVALDFLKEACAFTMKSLRVLAEITAKYLDAIDVQ